MATILVEEFQKAIDNLYMAHHFKKKKDDVLNCILVSFEKKAVVFLATNSETCVRIKVNIKFSPKESQSLDLKEYPVVLIPYQSLLDVKNKVSGRFMHLYSEKIHLRLENRSMSGYIEGRTNDLPHIDSFDDKIPKGEVTIARSEFIECIDTCENYTYIGCKGYTGKDLTPLLTRIHIVVTEDMARAEASDGEFMIRVTFPVQSQHTFDFTISTDFIATLLREKWEKVTIGLYHDRIVATIDGTGKMEIQGMMMKGLYPSRSLDLMIGKTMASTVLSSRVDPHEILRFLDNVGSYKKVTFVCDQDNLHVHELDSGSANKQLHLKRNTDDEGIAWATLAQQKLSLVCRKILPTATDIIFHLSADSLDRLAAVITYEHGQCSFTVAIGQSVPPGGSLSEQQEQDVVDAYSVKPLLPEVTDDDDTDTFGVSDDFFPEGFFDQ